MEPIIWNKRTGNIVGGHQREKILAQLGATEIDCVLVDMDEQKEKALNIALNKISGDWDDEKLAPLLTDLNASNFDMALTRFDASEIDALFKDDLKELLHTKMSKASLHKLSMVDSSRISHTSVRSFDGNKPALLSA